MSKIFEDTQYHQCDLPQNQLLKLNHEYSQMLLQKDQMIIHLQKRLDEAEAEKQRYHELLFEFCKGAEVSD